MWQKADIHTVYQDILKQHSTDRTIKEYAVRYMRDVTKSFDYTILAIGEYKQKIKDELTRLNVGPNPIIDQVLSSLSI